MGGVAGGMMNMHSEHKNAHFFNLNKHACSLQQFLGLIAYVLLLEFYFNMPCIHVVCEET